MIQEFPLITSTEDDFSDSASPSKTASLRDLASILAIAEELRLDKRFEEAEALLSDAMEHFGEHPGIIVKLAWIAYQKDDFEEALRRWARVRELLPNNSVGYSAGVATLQKMRRFSEADQLSSEGLKLFPDDVGVFSQFAWTAHHARDWVEAAARWNRFRRHFPKLVMGYQKEAVALLRMKRFSEADEVISQGLMLFENDKELLATRAECAASNGRFTQPALTVRYGDHLFISSDTNFVNQQHDGTVPISEEQKVEWLSILSSRKKTLYGMCGASFLFVLAPDKQTVYRHLLPARYSIRQAAFLANFPDTVDVAPLLSQVAKRVDVYTCTDSHWNQLGAYIAADMILARLGKSTPPLDVAWFEQTYVGDLGNKRTPIETSPRLIANFKSQSRLIYDNCVPNNGRIRIWSKPKISDGKTQSRLLLFGDSFSYDLVHFFKESFDVVVHVHAFAVDFRLVDVFQPNHVVCEITERFVIRLPKPGDGEPLTDLWKDKVNRRDKLESLNGVVAMDQDCFPAEAINIAEAAEHMFASFRAQMLK